MTEKCDYVIYNIKKGLLVSNFKVDFYKEIDGKKPVGVFIRSLDIKMKAKVVANLHLLEEYGNLAREPLSKELEEGIFELRTIEGNDIVRILYFFDKEKIVIATNGFVKKQQKTPRSEIDLAKQRRVDYHSRKEAGTYE
ncbi:type II toxin-antitoxin system RelE/ParE family toxin [Butyrivibrio sp. JL13D10]|uniref:type II toxin-antitoxin system RelE/ParE family toxin n=1 Tax=Butyrivibrio sp. JL13D10 TaxID=3236815 RepID=UPI0038B59ABB